MDRLLIIPSGETSFLREFRTIEILLSSQRDQLFFARFFFFRSNGKKEEERKKEAKFFFFDFRTVWISHPDN